MDEIDLIEAGKLFTIKQNQLKMVSRRGYNIDREKHLLLITLQQFLETYVPFAKEEKKTMRQVLSQPYQNDEGEKLFVYYADGPPDKQQLGVESVGDGIISMDKYRAKNGIIITPKPLSSSARKKIESLVSYNIYIFLESEMVYDPTEHYLTPEHVPLTNEEQRDFLKRNELSIDQFPIILTTDMIARYYGFLPGQVIRINRVNLYDTIVQNSVSYRVVKEDASEI